MRASVVPAWVIRAHEGMISEQELSPGEPESLVWGGFPFEGAIDWISAGGRVRRPLVAGPVHVRALADALTRV